MTVDPKVVSRGKGFNSLLREFLTAAQVSFSRAPDPKVVLSKYVTTCVVEMISLEDQKCLITTSVLVWQLPGVPTMTVSIHLTPKNNWRMERRASWYFRNVLMKSFAVLDGDLAPVCGGCASRTCATTKSETPLSWIPQ